MFTNIVRLFTLNLFNIKVDPSWLLIAALFTWGLSHQFFPDVLPGSDISVYLGMAVISMLGLFASLVTHELAHSAVARHLGVPIKSITLFLFGGVTEPEAEPISARVEFWIALAGPVMSLCVASGFWALKYIAMWSGFPAATVEIISYLALANLVLALLNLLPAFPLDGGRILRAVLWSRSGDVLGATRSAAKSGPFLAYALMAMGVLALFQGAPVAGLWQIVISAFVLFAACASYLRQPAKSVFDGQTVGALMTPDPVTVSPDLTLSEFVNQIMLQEHVTFVPVIDDGILLGYMDTSILEGIDRENWANTRIGDVFVGLNEGAVTSTDVPVQELIETIVKTGQCKFLVVSDHDLLGVISLSDLTRYLHSLDQEFPPHDMAKRSCLQF